MMIPNYETGGFNTMQNYLSTIVLAEDYAKEFRRADRFHRARHPVPQA